MNRFPKELRKKLQERKDNNAHRVLSCSSATIDFASNDYLGFAKNRNIQEKARLRLQNETFVNGSSGSRLLSGSHPLHAEVETMLASVHNAEAALLYNSGYDANVGLFSAVLQKGATVLYDALIHASIRDGIRLSNANAYKFQHNSLQDLEKKFAKCKGPVYIAVEAVYSMDGDCAPLEALVAFSKSNNCYLIVDEAHSNGVFGEKGTGLLQKLNLENEVFARVHTFGKALGCHGAAVLGAPELRDYLINFSRSFIYTTAASLHTVAVIASAYQELEQSPALQKLHSNISFFKEMAKACHLTSFFIESSSAIQSCIFPGNERVKKMARQLRALGFEVKAVLAPTVPQGQERMRFCLHSDNTFEEIEEVLRQLAIFAKV
jgi:8-amino-7-oxononanoate synthase